MATLWENSDDRLLLLSPKKKRTRRSSSFSGLCSSNPSSSSSSSASSGSSSVLSCVGLRSKRRRKLVTLLVGKERRVFRVEPHFLEHGVVQCLLEKTARSEQEGMCNVEEEDKENKGVLDNNGQGIYRAGCEGQSILVNCDAILFEHILWLLNKDDPSLRHLNLDELMEFYS